MSGTKEEKFPKPSKEYLDNIQKEAQKQYEKDFGFQKCVHPQVPVSGYELESIERRKDEPIDPWSRPIPAPVKAMVNRTPSSFKGRRTGSVYGGNRKR